MIRATCPNCDRSVRIRNDGRFARHNTGRSQRMSGRVCELSGIPARIVGLSESIAALNAKSER